MLTTESTRYTLPFFNLFQVIYQEDEVFIGLFLLLSRLFPFFLVYNAAHQASVCVFPFL